ncbi:RDD family protein [Ornithinimicrobium sp. W1679]|uniref:RDD family protein n=1 Tax=Ornithinimicrobium sp. W1679 TaxID=3418770 RepID=UPI003CEC4B8B
MTSRPPTPHGAGEGPGRAGVPRRWHPAPGPRVTSWLVDWAVVGGWLGVLTLVAFLAPSPWASAQPSTPTAGTLLLTDLLVTVATVVPYVLYLSLTETSRARATLGKRVAHLAVAGAEGGRAADGAVWVRNLVKASPWQLAHLGVSRAVLDVQPGAAAVLVVLSLALVAACAVPSLVGGRGVHDRMAGTRVEQVGGDGPAPAAVPPTEGR